MLFVRRVVRPLLLVAAALAVLVYFVFPTRTFQDQRAALSEIQADVDAIEAENAQLNERVQRLQTTDEVERLARRDFGLIYPDEEVYAILPVPAESLALPPTWPFNVLADNVPIA